MDNNIRVINGRELSQEEIALFTQANTYRKKTLVHAAESISDGYIDTLEGQMYFHAGDFLVSDCPPTHAWPVRRDIFLQTYELEGGDD